MNSLFSSKEQLREFQDFLNTDPVKPPEYLSEQILSRVRRDLNPSVWFVFLKVIIIHFVVGSVSLLLCPQFGLSPIGHRGIMGLMMKLGEPFCMFGCGVIYVTMSALIASLLLRYEEVRMIRSTELLQWSVLSLFSLGAFICLGAKIVFTLAVFWVLGFIIGGFASLELGWIIRTKFHTRHAIRDCH